MFVIASGEVEVELGSNAVRLGAGQFFGERALLDNALRSASVRATEPSRLLELDAGDLKLLMERNEDIGRRIRLIASQRAMANSASGEE